MLSFSSIFKILLSNVFLVIFSVHCQILTILSKRNLFHIVPYLDLPIVSVDVSWGSRYFSTILQIRLTIVRYFLYERSVHRRRLFLISPPLTSFTVVQVGRFFGFSHFSVTSSRQCSVYLHDIFLPRIRN